MKTKTLIAILIITSLIGYLEWGGNNKIFIAQAEIDIFRKIFHEPLSVIHPLTILPLVGQLLLLLTLFQNKPNKRIIILGMSGIGLLYLMIHVTGILSKNLKILISSIPYLLTCILMIRTIRKE